ncbi:hypothetical protein PYK79_33335 [Streptomyces sp. ID05-04B]|uniref:hypothetical protein n=1 Tax=unclassified Streptomyces TaxID=2593676 RepID=UPI00131ED676|nr:MULTISPECIES: hypothetical protein [unclassified Streptomyces]MDX5567165.1 hypothetical protein [Streptomyces sp. ID05-04B]
MSDPATGDLPAGDPATGDLPAGDPATGDPSDERRPEARQYEPPPSAGKLLLWILLFLTAALAVVLGGVYFT